jgi:hypothetical protein
MKTQTLTSVEPHGSQLRTGDAQVAERAAEASPRLVARIAGIFFSSRSWRE